MEYYLYQDADKKSSFKSQSWLEMAVSMVFSNSETGHKEIAGYLLNQAIRNPNTRVSIVPKGLMPTEEYRDGVINAIKDLLRVSADDAKPIKGDRIIMLAPGSNHIVAFQEKDFSEYKEPEQPFEYRLDHFLQWANKHGWTYTPSDNLWSESVPHKPPHRSKVATGYLYNKYLNETGKMK